jgi:hypothetical protein
MPRLPPRPLPPGPPPELQRRKTVGEYFREYEYYLLKDTDGIEDAKITLESMYTDGLIKEKMFIQDDEHNVLSISIKYLSFELVEFIFQHNYLDEGEIRTVDVQTGRGRTPLMIACEDYGVERDDSIYDETEQIRSRIINLILEKDPLDIQISITDRDHKDFKFYARRNPNILERTKNMLLRLDIGSKKKKSKKSKKQKKPKKLKKPKKSKKSKKYKK